MCPNISKDDVFCSNINRMLPQQDMIYKKQANKTEHYQEGITNRQHCHLLEEFLEIQELCSTTLRIRKIKLTQL